MVQAEGVCGSLEHSNSHRREVTNISTMEDNRLWRGTYSTHADPPPTGQLNRDGGVGLF